MTDAGQAASARSPVAGRIACGCAVGCLVLVALLAGGLGLVYHRVGKPAARAVEDAERVEQEAAAAARELARLDEVHPSPWPDGSADVVLADTDVDTYVSLRRALAPPLHALESARGEVARRVAEAESREAPTLADVLGSAVGDLVGEVTAAEAHRDLLVAAVPALEEQGLGHGAAVQLAEIIEWRFLGLDDAWVLGLPEWRREEAYRLRRELRWLSVAGAAARGGLQVQVDGAGPEERRAEVRRRLDELRSEAESRRQLREDTRERLEARRAELQALQDAARPPVSWLAAPPGTWGPPE